MVPTGSLTGSNIENRVYCNMNFDKGSEGCKFRLTTVVYVTDSVRTCILSVCIFWMRVHLRLSPIDKETKEVGLLQVQC